ncbi:NADH-quinone oxidoreductase subunit K, partial [Streptomyces massasporeus]
RNRGSSDIDRLRDTAETDDAESLPDADTDTEADADSARGTTSDQATAPAGKAKKAEATA